jgi:hypothetical protein
LGSRWIRSPGRRLTRFHAVTALIGKTQKNDCLVYRWERTWEDSGKTMFYAQVWLPNRKKPIFDQRKGYESHDMREENIASALAAIDQRQGTNVIKDADTKEDAVAQAGLFDHLGSVSS